METVVPFLLGDTHGLVAQPGCSVHASSAELGWNSLFVSAQREEAFEASVDPVGDHLIVIHLSGPVPVSGAVDRHKVSKLVPPGSVFLWPAGLAFRIGLKAPLETLHLYIRSRIVDDVAAALGYSRRGSMQLSPRLGEPDELLEQLAREVRFTATSGAAASSLYVDHLALAIAARLVRHDAVGLDCPAPPKLKGLTNTQFKRVEGFIEASLGFTIDLQSLSTVCGLSVSHFVRQFKLTTGLSPHQYVLRRRVERAKCLLKDTDEPVVQVAIACGFSHQEHLTHAFRRYTGDTPASFRRHAHS
jgi:AraC family transcriptional regulator